MLCVVLQNGRTLHNATLDCCESI